MLKYNLKQHNLLLTTLLIFFSRIPFLSNGFGVEEDAWGMVLTARNIAQTGVYEYSRLPGHPVPEFVYALISHASAFWFNLLTDLLSTTGILFFMLAMKKLNIKNYLLAGFAVAFTPVVYVASTNIMDYTWAMAFILISFYLLSSKQPVLAGLALGLAIGCRMTSGLFVLPFVVLCNQEGDKRIFNMRTFQFILATSLVGVLVFLPVINRYGLAFLDTYSVTYPSFAKALYKFTFPVWGVPGLLTIVILKCILLKKKILFNYSKPATERKLIGVSIVIFIMHGLLFWTLPQKSAFMIPTVPFIIVIMVLYLNNVQFSIVTGSLLVSCFAFGINLSDPYRGATASAAAIHFSVGRTQTVFDPLHGVLTDDFLKRKQRLAYSQKIIAITDTLNDNCVLIAGWWLGDILVQQKPDTKRKTLFYYYVDEVALHNLKQKGHKIYFLPDQDVYNDEREGRKFTRNYADDWPY